MSHKFARSAVIVLILAAPFVSTTAGASTPNPLSILTKALSDGSHESSMTISATFTGSGINASLVGGFSSKGNGGVTTLPGVGSEDIVTPVGKSYCFVKASTLAVLSEILDVKTPTASEVGVWYEVPKSDPRYTSIASSGAQTVAESFSFTPVGWSRKATYGGTTVLRGVRVIKLEAASNLFASGSGFGKSTLYVTDTSNSLPFAMSGPAGTSGLVYFSKWGTTSVVFPTTTADLPK